MRNAGLEETQAGIKISRRNINNRYKDDTTVMAESKEVQNCFKKKMERRLAFWFLVVRPGVGAQFHSCRQGLAWIELLFCNPDPGTKGESTQAS